MRPPDSARIGYVVKRYPRYSETFIVNEILAHEAAGTDVTIFALRPPVDTHFQELLARVRAPVHYLLDSGKAADFWRAIDAAQATLPGTGDALAAAAGEEATTVYQAIRLAQAIRAHHLDHLHAHFATSAASVARLAARFACVPWSFTAHAKDIFHESVVPADLARKLADADAVITVSDYNQAFLQAEYGAAATGVHRLYNGLDLGRFLFHESSDRPPNIVAVGRLVEKKGFDVLVDACARLKANGVRFTCTVIGSGDQEEGLRAQIQHLGVGDVVLLEGPRPQAEVIDAVAEAAVFAAPCVVGRDGNRDGLPTVLLEAMALGTPCVSTDVTGIPEILRDGETGLTVPQHDAPALAKGLARLLADAPLRARLAANARLVIEAEFDIHRNAARQRALFAACAHADNRPPFQPTLEVTA
ncbi:MAG: glycosyltransferase family 4 protein [Rhodothermaceae bacterium]|nr:glycosyltransferase family 4 protein [Rhodothermaceae bacterium]